MALSENAQTLLEALDSGGRAANPATLHRKLGWSEEELDSAADEVCQAGLAEKQGSRLARVISGAGVSQEAEMLLAALQADGSTVGGLRLRSSLDLDNDTFTQAKQELRTAGLIVLGVGRGGRTAERFVPPRIGILEETASRRHQFVLGRRGVGKSTLLGARPGRPQRVRPTASATARRRSAGPDPWVHESA